MHRGIKRSRVSNEQPENNFFQKLPLELTKYIADAYLKLGDVAALGQTYTGMHRFFAADMSQAKAASHILEFVAQGNQDAAQKLIEENPELLTVRSRIKDWTGRTFESISTWEYLLWALDTRFMANMVLACIPSNGAGKVIRDKLLSQYGHLEEYGVTYEFNGEIINESHFSFEPLITALEGYVAEFDQFDDESRKNYWIREVGGEQRHLVVHARQHYCGPRQMTLARSFDENDLTRTIKFYEHTTNGPRQWDSSASSDTTGVGIDFAIRSPFLPGRLGPAVYAGIASRKFVVDLDAKSIRALYLARMNDFTLLKEKLENLFEYECESTIPNCCV